MAKIEGMPKFGLSMEEGVLTEWLVPVGAAVKRGQPIAVIEAEKLVNNAAASQDGVMLIHYLEPGDAACCGAPICAVGEPGEAPPHPGKDPSVSTAAAMPAAESAVAAASPVPPCATPRAKAVISARGLDAARITGTGRGGAITVDDVRAYADAPEEPAQDVRLTPRARLVAEELGLACAHIRGTGLLGMVTVADVKAQGRPKQGPKLIPMTGVQRVTAETMKRSLAEAAQGCVCIEASFAPLTDAYRRLKPVYAAEGVRLTYTAMIVWAVGRALAGREDVRMQYYDAKNFVLTEGVHVGVAVELERGLVVPVVRDADKKPLRSICRDIALLSEKARSGALTEADMGGAVTTVTSLAAAGATAFTPILNPPETTILGVCRMRDTAVVRDGGIHIEPVMNLCLTYDHRVINGAPACRYVGEIVELLNKTEWN